MASLYQNFPLTDFHSRAQAITTNIKKINQNVTSMRWMFHQLNGHHDVSAGIRRELHQLSQSTAELAKGTGRELKELSKCNNNGSDQQAMKIKTHKLTQDFGYALNSFQAIQKQAVEREEEVFKSDHEGSHQQSPYKLEGPPMFGDQQRHPQQQRNSQVQLMMEEEESELEEARERGEAIRQLESNIVDVNQIFRDLAVMVHDQGDTIDSIEANIESANVQTVEGVKQLSQAHVYQNKARKMKLFIFLVLTVVAFVLGLILYFSVFK